MGIEIPEIKLCECGCGQETTLVTVNCKNRNMISGEYRRFVHGHNGKGHNHRKWNGGVKKHSKGYVLLQKPEHPKADKDGYVFEHIIVAENIVGYFLPEHAVVHHINGNRSDNSHINLVICNDMSYHFLLHNRERALKACGHADWLKCTFCKQYDDPQNIFVGKQKNKYHLECRRQYEKNYRSKKNGS